MANEERRVFRFEALRKDDQLRRFHARFFMQEDKLKEKVLKFVSLKASLGKAEAERASCRVEVAAVKAEVDAVMASVETTKAAL